MPLLDLTLQEEAVEHIIGLQAYSSSIVRRVSKLLDEAEADILAQLRDRIAKIQARGYDTGTWTTQRTRRLLRDIRSTNAEAYNVLGKELRDELEGLSRFEAVWQSKKLEDVLPFSWSITKPSKEQLLAIVQDLPLAGSSLPQEISRNAANHFQRVSKAVSLGMVQGESIPTIVRRVRKTTDIAKHHAEAVVRTSVTHTAARSREYVYEANQDLVQGVRYVATLDGNTTLICASLDGEIFPIHEGPRPPQHFNCRSTTAPALKSLKDLGLSKKEVSALTSAQRSSLAGPVSGRLTFDKWIRTQPPDFFDRYYGEYAAIMRANPMLRTKDLLDPRTLLPLTLEEVAAKAGVVLPGEVSAQVAAKAASEEARTAVSKAIVQVREELGGVDDTWTLTPAEFDEAIDYYEKRVRHWLGEGAGAESARLNARIDLVERLEARIQDAALDVHKSAARARIAKIVAEEPQAYRWLTKELEEELLTSREFMNDVAVRPGLATSRPGMVTHLRELKKKAWARAADEYRTLAFETQSDGGLVNLVDIDEWKLAKAALEDLERRGNEILERFGVTEVSGFVDELARIREETVRRFKGYWGEYMSIEDARRVASSAGLKGASKIDDVDDITRWLLGTQDDRAAIEAKIARKSKAADPEKVLAKIEKKKRALDEKYHFDKDRVLLERDAALEKHTRIRFDYEGNLDLAVQARSNIDDYVLFGKETDYYRDAVATFERSLGKLTKEERAEFDRWLEAYEEYRRLEKLYREGIDGLKKVREELQAAIGEAIGDAKNTTGIDASYTTTFAGKKGAKRKAVVEEALDWLRVHFRGLDDISERLEVKGTRGRAYQSGHAIHLDAYDTARTAIHEVGHWIEEFGAPEIHRACLKFLRERSKGERAQWLGTLTGNSKYKRSEIAWADKFFTPYVGKDYGGQATEVLSMGLEYLFADPDMFLRKDREHFLLILRIILGAY